MKIFRKWINLDPPQHHRPNGSRAGSSQTKLYKKRYPKKTTKILFTFPCVILYSSLWIDTAPKRIDSSCCARSKFLHFLKIFNLVYHKVLLSVWIMEKYRQEGNSSLCAPHCIILVKIGQNSPLHFWHNYLYGGSRFKPITNAAWYIKYDI